MSDKLNSLMNSLGQIDGLRGQTGGGINKRSARPPSKIKEKKPAAWYCSDWLSFTAYKAWCMKPHYKFSIIVSVESVLNA